MNFESFLHNINTDETYKQVVKDILSNNKLALTDAPEYLKNNKDLVLFGAKFGGIVEDYMSKELWSDKDFLIKLAKLNHSVAYKLNEDLRKDKMFLRALAKANHKTMLFISVDELIGE